MHREKIDHFYKFRTSASEEFPTFRSLSEVQCAEVPTNLQQRFAFLKGLDGKKMGDAIFATCKALSNVNAEDESFQGMTFLTGMRLQPMRANRT